MMTTTRRLLLSGCATLGLLLGTTVVPGIATADHAASLSSTAAPKPAAAPPGDAGDNLTLASHADVGSWDAVVDDAGNTYLGWIADTSGSGRRVWLCRIPHGSRGCVGGLQSTDPGPQGGNSASSLRVLDVDGTITFVWFHDTNSSVGNPRGAEIATATVTGGGGLSPSSRAAFAPSFGGMYDADVAPDGSLWVVTWDDSGDTVQVDGPVGGAVKEFNPAFMVGQARIAFDHDQAVVALDEAGAVGEPVRVMSQHDDGTWSAISKVDHTWSLGGDWDLARGRGSNVRLVASVPKASFFPQIARWKGSHFGSFHLTGYKGSCQFNTHDLYADASGRFADIFNACGPVRIFNQPKATKAAMASFKESGTPVGGNSFERNGPQIATSPRGTGWVMWAVLSDPSGTTLKASPVRLPALPRKASHKTTAGKVTVVGPVSCMPAVDLGVKVKAKHGSGWSVVSKSLKLDGSSQGKTLQGARLSPGSSHTLTGTAVFKKGGQRKTVSVDLPFKACPAP